MKYFYSTLALIFVSSVLFAQLPSYVPTNGLLAYYPFNGNVNDASSNGNNGIVYGATLSADHLGNANSAYHFDGNGQYIEIPHSNSLNSISNQMTVSFWVKVESFPSGNFGDIIISKQSGSGVSQSGYNIYQVSQNAILLQVSSGGGNFGGASVPSDTSNYNIFHHVVLCFDNGNSTSYLDGVLISTGSSTATIGANTMPMLFGKANWTNINANPFNGILDDVGIWNRVLTSTEVTDLYNGSGTISNCLVSSYPFSGNALDNTGNGNDGIVNGASLTTDRFGNSNSAYQFNGISDYIQFASSPITNDQPFSIAAWVYLDTSVVDLPILSFGCTGSSTLNEGTFGFYPGTNFLTFETGGANDITSQNTAPQTHQWVHVAVTHTSIGYTANAFRFYVNGIPYSNNTHGGTNNPFPFNNLMSIGRMHGGGSLSFFKGKIDDLFIYDCALSDSEIIALYGYNPSNATACDTAYFGNNLNNFFGKSTLATDGNFVTVGTINEANNWSDGDIVLNKYDTDLNLIWSRDFYAAGGKDRASNVITTSDGGYLISSAFGNSNPAGMFSAGYIIKTDSNGIQQWVQTLIGQSYGDNYGASAVENSNGEFVCYGHVQHHSGCSSYATRITKLSSTGGLIWSYCIQLNPDLMGGFDKLSSSDDYISTYNDNSTGNIEIRKWNDNGSQTGMIGYKFQNTYSSRASVKRCSYGGFFLLGQYDSTSTHKNAFLAKFDDNMSLIWESSFNANSENYFYAMTEDNIGNIICTGSTNITGQPSDLVAAIFDSNGLQLNNAIFGNSISNEFAIGVVAFPNGEIICSGLSDTQALLVNFCDLDSSIIAGTNEIYTPVSELQVYPNPSSDLIYIDYSLNRLSDVKISVYNLMGEVIYSYIIKNETTGKKQFVFNANEIGKTGIYFLNFSSGNSSLSQKLVILR
jgi:hypothetical protein